MVNQAIRAIYKKMSKVARKARRRDNAYRELCYHAYSESLNRRDDFEFNEGDAFKIPRNG